MTTTIEVRPAGRLRGAWAAAHHPVPGVRRSARNAACAVPYTVLPASLWRIALSTFHVPIGRGQIGSGVTSSGLPGVPIELYVIVLSVASELPAFTAVGLCTTVSRCFSPMPSAGLPPAAPGHVAEDSARRT